MSTCSALVQIVMRVRLLCFLPEPGSTQNEVRLNQIINIRLCFYGNPPSPITYLSLVPLQQHKHQRRAFVSRLSFRFVLEKHSYELFSGNSRVLLFLPPLPMFSFLINNSSIRRKPKNRMMSSGTRLNAICSIFYEWKYLCRHFHFLSFISRMIEAERMKFAL